jgi:crotonobetainyl-CoA:carnitine CoA-transferase CaiB-like acyl-CoA transferase
MSITTQPSPGKSGPLVGSRGLNLTSVLTEPHCTQILADSGADVIKVESPDSCTSQYICPTKTLGQSGTFTNLLRGKRGIVLDLCIAEGRDLRLQLAHRAGIVLGSNAQTND